MTVDELKLRRYRRSARAKCNESLDSHVLQQRFTRSNCSRGYRRAHGRFHPDRPPPNLTLALPFLSCATRLTSRVQLTRGAHLAPKFGVLAPWRPISLCIKRHAPARDTTAVVFGRTASDQTINS
ncbi:MAG: hypothetical protein RL701_778 [Pseudomonadota bacterium]